MGRKFIIIFFALVFSIPAFAQLEVKEGSFKEVPGFININPDQNYQTDDNDLPFAVIKIRTENITDKQRRDLSFEGNGGTFIMLEYKKGEVWVYLTAKYADYLKISHPDFGVVEFTLPYDLMPKKGYEMALVYKPYAPAAPVYGTIVVATDPTEADVYIDSVQKGKTPLIINDILVGNHELRLEKSGYLPLQKSFSIDGLNILSMNEKLNVEPKKVTPKPKMEKKEKIKVEKPKIIFKKYTFIALHSAVDSYSKPSFGLSVGSVKNMGWFFNAMSNFNFKGLSADYECGNDLLIDGHYPIYTGVEEYSSMSVMTGPVFRISTPIAIKIGAGYGLKSLCYEKKVDNKYVRNTDISVSGINASVGTIVKIKRFVVSVDCEGTPPACPAGC